MPTLAFNYAPERVQKLTTDKLNLVWKFRRWMDDDEAISTVDSVTVSPSGALTMPGTPGISSDGFNVSVLTGEDGASGSEYEVNCKVTTDKGQKFGLIGVVEVT